MTFPPVVSDPEVCAARLEQGRLPPEESPHVWRWAGEPWVGTGYKVCRYCGGRKP